MSVARALMATLRCLAEDDYLWRSAVRDQITEGRRR
jgi:hypothetical protein